MTSTTLMTEGRIRKLTEFCMGLSFQEYCRLNQHSNRCILSKSDTGPTTSRETKNQTQLGHGHSRAACNLTGSSVQNLSRISDGWECDVYSFDLVTPATVVPLILRMYMDKPESQAAIKCQREFDVMKHLYNAGNPLPQVFGCETDAACLGAPFVVMERICGTTLAQAYSGGRDDEKRETLDIFTSLYIRLHNLNPADFDQETASLSTHSIIQKEFSEFERYRRFLDDDIFGPALSWLEANMHQVKPSRPSIIHYDFHAQNILVGDGSRYRLKQDKSYGPCCVESQDCRQDDGQNKNQDEEQDKWHDEEQDKWHDERQDAGPNKWQDARQDAGIGKWQGARQDDGRNKWQDNVFVIDWTQSRVSDFRFDLAWSLLLMGDFEGQEMLKSYMNKMGADNDSKSPANNYGEPLTSSDSKSNAISIDKSGIGNCRQPCIDNGGQHSIDNDGSSIYDSQSNTGNACESGISDDLWPNSTNTSGRTVEDLDYFLVFACVRRLASIYGSIKHGADRFGMRPGAEEIMKKQSKHIRRLYDILTNKSGLELPELERWVAQVK